MKELTHAQSIHVTVPEWNVFAVGILPVMRSITQRYQEGHKSCYCTHVRPNIQGFFFHLCFNTAFNLQVCTKRPTYLFLPSSQQGTTHCQPKLTTCGTDNRSHMRGYDSWLLYEKVDVTLARSLKFTMKRQMKSVSWHVVGGMEYMWSFMLFRGAHLENSPTSALKGKLRSYWRALSPKASLMTVWFHLYQRLTQ